MQRELEAWADAGNPAVVLCDRGIVDGFAYWPGPESFWESVGSTLAEQIDHYDAVIHLRTPSGDGGYEQENRLRIEVAAEAASIDRRIVEA